MTDPNDRFDCSEEHPACLVMRRDSRNQGVADPDNLPFMLCPPGAKTAALLVHGFTATPWEMRLFAEALAKAGIASLAVRLPGHGTTPEDLAGRRLEEWSSAVLDGYQALSGEFHSIFGVGMSTGCLLLLATAGATPFRGLVLFSPYLRVRHKLAPWAGWLRWIRPYQTKAAESETDRHYYNRRPLAGVHQINRLLQTVRNRLAQVVCPVLAFNGEDDQTIEIDSARQLMERLGSDVKIHEIYGPDAPHVLTREDNPCREPMFALAASFLQELELPGSATQTR